MSVATAPNSQTPPRSVDEPAPAEYTRSASQQRALHPDFVSTWSLGALLPKLPLVFPVEAALPPSPKARYLSEYRYLGPDALADPTRLASLSDFELALYLIDFAPLESLLARRYLPSRKGQVPYHPVSLFLCVCLKRDQALKWRALARLLRAEEHGAGWRRLFGFSQSQTPCASTLRSFYYTVGPSVFDDLCPRFVRLLHQLGLFPEHSTYPGDPTARGITVTQDGMLHPARSRPSCQLAEEVCYQSLPTRSLEPDPDQALPPSPTVERPCRARSKGHQGCRCDSPDCQVQCRRASRLDPAARFIHYAGHNHKRGSKPNAPTANSGSGAWESGPRRGADRGTNVFGYRSVCDRAIDDRYHVAWNLQTGLYPANTDERTIFKARLAGLRAKYPNLAIGEWLDDSGVGYDECLEAVFDLGALRMIDIRAHQSDEDRELCLSRGYDGQGRPLCPHGYPLRSNGYDQTRRRTKYVCEQACRRKALAEGAPVQPVAGCPYLDDKRPLGLIVNVGKTLPDGSLRLAREVPYGSQEWQARYARRNLSESRNGQLEMMGLKRMNSYGLDHNTREVQLADFLVNLRTLARLIREATSLQSG